MLLSLVITLGLSFAGTGQFADLIEPLLPMQAAAEAGRGEEEQADWQADAVRTLQGYWQRLWSTEPTEVPAPEGSEPLETPAAPASQYEPLNSSRR